MTYKNTKTGAVITIASVLCGGDWVEVPAQPAEKPAPKKKRGVKKDEANN